MRIFNWATIRRFIAEFPDAEGALLAWYAEANDADWASPATLEIRYPSASIVGAERVVFNIRGNKYRLIVEVKYRFHAVYVRWFGRHADYDTIDAKKV